MSKFKKYLLILCREAGGVAAALFMLALLAVGASAVVPATINYQGRLKQSGLPVNGSVNMTFRITDAAGGTQYWTSGSVPVVVSSGLFNHVLGGAGDTSDLSQINWAGTGPFYIEAQIPTGNTLTPREQINASAFSMYSSSAAYSFGVAAANVQAGTLPNAVVITTGNVSASGAASASTYLRGDGTWGTPAGGVTLAGNNNFTGYDTFGQITVTSITITGGNVVLTATATYAQNAAAVNNGVYTNANNNFTGYDTFGQISLASATFTGANVVLNATATYAKTAGAVPAAGVSAGTMLNTVIVSSIQAGAMWPAGMASGTFPNGVVITTGNVSAAGTASGTTYLRGDGTWGTPAGSGGASVYPATATAFFPYGMSVSTINVTGGNVVLTATAAYAQNAAAVNNGVYANANNNFTGYDTFGQVSLTSATFTGGNVILNATATYANTAGAVPAGGVSAGALGASVIASSIAVNGVYPGAVRSGTYPGVIISTIQTGDYENIRVGTATTAVNFSGNVATVASLAGGAAGDVPYQSNVNVTAMLAPGTSGYVLKSGAAAAPTWSTVLYDNGANVGIGTGNPYARLDLGSAGGVRELVNGQGTGATYMTGFGVNLNGTPANSFDIFMGNGAGQSIDFDYALEPWPYTSFTSLMNIQNTGNVGIGTTAPAGKFEVMGTSSFTVLSNGNVGIGTAPALPLHILTAVAGNAVSINNTVGNAALQLFAGAGLTYTSYFGQINGTWSGFSNPCIWESNEDICITPVLNNAADGINLLTSGNVGIGTTAPKGTLQVGAAGLVVFSNTDASIGTTGDESGEGNGSLTLEGDLYFNEATPVVHTGSGAVKFPNGLDTPTFQSTGNATLTIAGGTSGYTNFNNGGKVGIGIAAPTYPFQISTTFAGDAVNITNSGVPGSNAIIELWAPSSSYGTWFGQINSTWYGYTEPSIWEANDDICITAVLNSPASGMVLTTAGRLGIGVTNPTYLLQVNAANPACNGSTVWTNYSDGRLKENVKPLEGGVLDKLTLLKPSTFNYNDKYFSLTGYDAKTKNTLYGFIAQDIIKVFPDMVNERELKDGNKYYDTNLSSLQIYLVKAIQEMNEKISGQRKAIDEEQRQLDKLENLLKDKERAVDGLEKRVAALEEKIKQLEKKRRVAI